MFVDNPIIIGKIEKNNLGIARGLNLRSIYFIYKRYNIINKMDPNIPNLIRKN